MKPIKTYAYTDAGLRSLGQPVKYRHGSARHMNNAYAFWTVEEIYVTIKRVSGRPCLEPIFIYAGMSYYVNFNCLCKSSKYESFLREICPSNIYATDASIACEEILSEPFLVTK
jgi:hypothetical protein